MTATRISTVKYVKPLARPLEDLWHRMRLFGV